MYYFFLHKAEVFVISLNPLNHDKTCLKITLRDGRLQFSSDIYKWKKKYKLSLFNKNYKNINK